MMTTRRTDFMDAFGPRADVPHIARKRLVWLQDTPRNALRQADPELDDRRTPPTGLRAPEVRLAVQRPCSIRMTAVKACLFCGEKSDTTGARARRELARSQIVPYLEEELRSRGADSSS